MGALKAVFLDRDGVIIKDTGFVKTPKQVRLLPKAAQAINRLHELGYLVIVISNQSGVARGFFSEITLSQINDEIKNRLAKQGAFLDDIYYCPHHPEAAINEYRSDCSCRKPKPGMILKAGEEHAVDLSMSYMIGDSDRDVAAGVAAGCRPVLIARKSTRRRADNVMTAGSLIEAVEKFVE